MHELLARDPRNAAVIRPFIGGDEVNNSPELAHHRFAIFFGGMSEEEARQYPDVMSVVEARVRPDRERATRAGHQRWWWRFAETRPGLAGAVSPLPRVIVLSKTSKYLAFAFLPSDLIFSEKLKVFPSASDGYFACLQSRLHEAWAQFFGGSRGETADYVPTDCFETFPFPTLHSRDQALFEIGKQYYDLRSELMIRNREGLTATYNRFHDPDETSPDILGLRALHDVMDRAVLDAYGWTDLRPTCEFLLDYEDEVDEGADSGRTRQRKKPWRYRWPDDIRDEVLARLLALNSELASAVQTVRDVVASRPDRTASRKTSQRAR